MGNCRGSRTPAQVRRRRHILVTRQLGSAVRPQLLTLQRSRAWEYETQRQPYALLRTSAHCRTRRQSAFQLTRMGAFKEGRRQVLQSPSARSRLLAPPWAPCELSKTAESGCSVVDLRVC